VDILAINLNPSLCGYFLLAVIGSLVVRFVTTLFAALEKNSEDSGSFFTTFKHFYLGKGSDENKSFDYFQTFVLGVMELSIFPVLLIANKPEYIGGWLVLKTLPQWNRWTEERWVYNRFLIGNALIIVFSYFLARWAIA